jgi:hypothetical protein
MLLVVVSGLPAMAESVSMPQTRIEQAMNTEHTATQKPTIETAYMPQTRIQQSVFSTQKQSTPSHSTPAQSTVPMTRVQQALANRQLGHWE